MSRNTTWERRQELYIRITHGQPKAKTIKEIAKKYNVSQRTVEEDWKNRDRWGTDFFEPAEADILVQDALFQLNEIRGRLYAMADREPPYENATAADQRWALGKLQEHTFKLAELQQSLGRIYTAPTKLEIDADVETIYNLIVEQCGEDNIKAQEDAARVLMKYAAMQRNSN